MKIYKIVLVGALSLVGIFAVADPANLQAQTNADIYTNAFQVTVPININNFTYTPVTIPAGYRLVIQNVSLSGAAQTNGAYVQPIILFSTTLGSNPANLRYFGPLEDPQVSGQYYADYETTMYADTLSVAPAFAGYTPTFMAFNVVITGYLVAPPPPPPSLKAVPER